MDITAVIWNYRISLLNSALTVQEPHLSFFHLVSSINVLHKLQNVTLLMAVIRNSCTYGNNFTQWLRIISVIKKAVVQSVERKFIRKLFLKSAAASFFHTLLIQYRKNNTTGKRNNK